MRAIASPGVEVAGDRDHDVVRDVVGAEEVEAGVDADLLDVALPADRRRAVGVRDEREREQRLDHLALRVVLAAHAALLEHDLALGVEHLGRDHEVPEALRLELDHEREMLGRDVLEVHRDVARGVGVAARAARAEQRVAHLAGHALAAAEHHVLEEMGDAGPARLVARSPRAPSSGTTRWASCGPRASGCGARCRAS